MTRSVLVYRIYTFYFIFPFLRLRAWSWTSDAWRRTSTALRISSSCISVPASLLRDLSLMFVICTRAFPSGISFVHTRSPRTYTHRGSVSYHVSSYSLDSLMSHLASLAALSIFAACSRTVIDRVCLNIYTAVTLQATPPYTLGDQTPYANGGGIFKLPYVYGTPRPYGHGTWRPCGYGGFRRVDTVKSVSLSPCRYGVSVS